MENLSASFACSGNISQMSMPETLVLMGRNSPRISEGASGFISYMSIWLRHTTQANTHTHASGLGPPQRQIMITDLSRFVGEAEPAALRRRKSERVRPPRASAPV